jgi:hypothetical protein
MPHELSLMCNHSEIQLGDLFEAGVAKFISKELALLALYLIHIHKEKKTEVLFMKWSRLEYAPQSVRL